MSEQRRVWPVYKGPVKIVFRKRDIPYDLENVKRHASTYTYRHGGSDHPYRLFATHYQPRHAKKDYRYAKNGRERRVLPPPPKAELQPSVKKVNPEDHVIPQGPSGTPPPREMLMFLHNDVYEHSFDLEAYRAKRKIKRGRDKLYQKNYFKELVHIDILVFCFSLIFLFAPISKPLKLIDQLLFTCSLVLLPILCGCLLQSAYRRKRL